MIVDGAKPPIGVAKPRKVQRLFSVKELCAGGDVDVQPLERIIVPHVKRNIYRYAAHGVYKSRKSRHVDLHIEIRLKADQ